LKLALQNLKPIWAKGQEGQTKTQESLATCLVDMPSIRMLPSRYR
jgi:hypothetical protein